MSKIIDEFRVGKYVVLKLDTMPQAKHRKYKIDSVEFEPVPIYDTHQCIAIESDENFIGKTVEFI